jgi:hypothetical protein
MSSWHRSVGRLRPTQERPLQCLPRARPPRRLRAGAVEEMMDTCSRACGVRTAVPGSDLVLAPAPAASARAGNSRDDGFQPAIGIRWRSSFMGSLRPILAVGHRPQKAEEHGCRSTARASSYSARGITQRFVRSTGPDRGAMGRTDSLRLSRPGRARTIYQGRARLSMVSSASLRKCIRVAWCVTPWHGAASNRRVGGTFKSVTEERP